MQAMLPRTGKETAGGENVPLDFHDPGCLTPAAFYSEYAMPLARAFTEISRRGVLIDVSAFGALHTKVQGEIEAECWNISAQLNGRPVIPKKPEKKSGKADPLVYNLASQKQTVEVLHGLNMKPPKRRRDNGIYSESVDDEALSELYAATGHPFLKRLIRVRELGKLCGTYLEVSLEDAILFGAYFVTGTVTGRRSCRTNFLGLGTNLQNQPKHTDLAAAYRACLKARPGHIFVKCDQIAAEDWIVCAIIADEGGDRRGLDELAAGEDRHAKLASYILGKPISECGKDTPARFLGKKVRHAGNYDMEAYRFSQVMSAEGFTCNESFCAHMLGRFHAADPGIKGVFHHYIQNQLRNHHALTNPFGFTRQFFALRPYDDNRKVIKEGYAQIPQSTVGINTGFAILWLEQHHPGYVLLDDHDAVTLETADRLDCVLDAAGWLHRAFDRVIRFPHGLTIRVPIEFEVGYSLGEMKTVKCDPSDRTGWTNFWHGLQASRRAQDYSISGPQQPLSAPAPAAIAG